MKQVTIYYRDSMDNYREEFMAGPYTIDKAKGMQEMLKCLGCKDFRVEDVKRAA